MTHSVPATQPNTRTGETRAYLWITGLISLAPYFIYHRYFADLMWFGDEWDQLDHISRHGFFPWVMQAFGENFVPLFKVLWGGLALLGDGSYLVMLTALWFTHALSVVMLGHVLRDAEFGTAPVVLALAVFGLASSNVETLAWSIQWSSVLTCLFLLMAVCWFNRRIDPFGPVRVFDVTVLSLLCAASALSFSRGVLTGACLAALCFVGPPAAIRETWHRRTVVAFACLLPAIATASVIMLRAGGNHQHLPTGGQLIEAGRFGSACFGLNPFLKLLGFAALSPVVMWLAASIKLGLIAHGLFSMQGKVLRLLLLLLLLDLGNCVLLGIGRHHTGIDAAVSSRYQYASLMFTLPFLGIAAGRLLALLHLRPLRLAATGLMILALAGVAARNWKHEISAYSGWRGRELRHTLFTHPTPPGENALPGIPFMPTARAKQLIEEYNLH